MRLARGRWRLGGVLRVGLLCFFVPLASSQFACRFYSLETPACSQARDTTKQFYSWYLGTDAHLKEAQPDIFSKHVVSTYFPGDGNAYAFERDPFFLEQNLPTTFKIGACKQIDPEKVDLQVQIYWRTDIKTVQKEIHVEAIKLDDAWLINKVTN